MALGVVPAKRNQKPVESIMREMADQVPRSIRGWRMLASVGKIDAQKTDACAKILNADLKNFELMKCRGIQTDDLSVLSAIHYKLTFNS